MTNKQWKAAWLRVAKAYGSAPSTRSDITNKMTQWGLCPAFAMVTSANNNDCGPELDLPMKALERFRYGKNSDDHKDYWFPNMGLQETHRYDNLRCLFACLFSNMTIKEFEEICQ